MALPTSFPTSLPRFNAGAILEQIQMLHHWPAQGDLLSFCYKMGPGEAALFVIFGVILLLFGINIFKFVVMLNAALAGGGIGAFICEKAGNKAGGGAVRGVFFGGVVG